MAWRPHGRAEVDPRAPSPFGICDRCGACENLENLRWQFQYAGVGLINLNILCCRTCLDVPQPQLTATILPPDPEPVYNARPEYYAVDEIDYITNQNKEILVDQNGDKLVANVASKNFSIMPPDPNNGTNPPNTD